MAYNALAKGSGSRRQTCRGNRNWTFSWTSDPTNPTDRQITHSLPTKHNILSPSSRLCLPLDRSILVQLRSIRSLPLLPLALLVFRIYHLLGDAAQDRLCPQSQGTRSTASRKPG